jgi:hypothetical protein
MAGRMGGQNETDGLAGTVAAGDPCRDSRLRLFASRLSFWRCR